MTKALQQERAKQLRAQGHSIKAIAELLDVSSSSVSVWVREVMLTAQQQSELMNSAFAQRGRAKGGITKTAFHQAIREKWREEGRTEARQNDPLHIKGCMLYWAEGGKDKGMVHFCNSNLEMLRLFIQFLRESMGEDLKKASFRIFCYDDVHSVETILDYWTQNLGILPGQMQKPIVNPYPMVAGKKKRAGKLPYGTCHLRVCDTRLAQRIYGALEVYGGVRLCAPPVAAPKTV